MDDSIRPEPKQKLPADAQRVFKGVLFDVYQWQQELFDGTRATFEQLRRPDTVVIVPVTEQGTIIVSTEKQPGMGWFSTLPCGGVDTGESPLAAAHRELFEETGYKAAHMDFWFSEQISSRVDWAVYVYIARGCKVFAPQKKTAGEDITTRECTFDEFLKVAATDDFQNLEVIRRLFQATQNPEGLAALRALFLQP
jgi:8-oxo-dGTP pyrophosphatase MutT (NUDIX family)